MEGGKKKLATLVGCNYAGTPNELQGCINDVVAMRDTLISRFGFAPGEVTVLTDEHGSPVLPTGANIKRALADMVAHAAAGDVLFFHYSGHGTLIPPVRPHHGHGARDEAIVPCDFNLITDVDFRRLVDQVPPGASFTMLSDSCHSGGLIDLEKEQIGPSVLAGGAHASASMPVDTRTTTRTRFLPYTTVIDHLSGVSGVDAGNHVAEHLLALFGTDASAKFHHHHHDGKQPAHPDDGILLSGCQTDETSADVAEDDEAAAGGKACGAFSNAIQTVLASHPAPVSNRELVAMARKLLSDQGFEQHPCLYCSDANAEAPFLWQDEEPAPVAVTAAAEQPAMSAL